MICNLYNYYHYYFPESLKIKKSCIANTGIKIKTLITYEDIFFSSEILYIVSSLRSYQVDYLTIV